SKYPVVEPAVAAADHQFAACGRLPRKAGSGREIVVRGAAAGGIAGGVSQDSRRQVALEVRRHDESGIRPCPRGSAGHGNGLNLTQPEVSQVAVLIRGKAIELPTHAQVQSYARANLIVILEKEIGVGDPVSVNDAARRGFDGEHGSEN